MQVAFAEPQSGQPDTQGEVPAVFVELTEGATVRLTNMAYAKKASMNGRTSPQIMDELPKTAVGKIFKPDLRRSAITRVYNGAGWAGVGAQVTAVLEDKSSAWRRM
jgi:acyl-coenzyme A synthetase/AMP-(fatty) acid ligase